MATATTISLIGTSIAILAFILSATTSWFTLLRRGHLKMTRPTVIFFGYDQDPELKPKIFLRALLFSTSVRGVVIENMYVKLRRGRSEITFGFWGHGETNQLVVGGLYVGQNGVAANHHFVLGQHADYLFEGGHNEVNVYAKVIGLARPVHLSRLVLDLTDDMAAQTQFSGVLFELQPEEQTYVGSARHEKAYPTDID